jgi:hypothetical protein
MAVILHILVSPPLGLDRAGLHPVGSHAVRSHAAMLRMDDVSEAMNGFKPPWFDRHCLPRGTAQTGGGQIPIELGRRERS